MHEGTIRDKTNQGGNSKSSSLLEHTSSEVQQIDSAVNVTNDKSLSALCNQFEESFKPNETQHSDAPNVPCVLRKSLLDPPASNSSVNDSTLTNSDTSNEKFVTTNETMIPLMK